MAVNVRIRNGMVRTLGEGGASEGDIRGNSTDMFESLSGVVDVSGGHLLVHEAASPDMTVIVDAGVGYIPNASFDEIDSDSVKFWEAVVSGTSGSRTLVIGANASGQTRIDIACLKIDPGATPDEHASDIAELIIVEGTPGAGVPATPDYYLKMANVTVVNGATEIEDSDIADTREQTRIKEAFLPANNMNLDSNQTVTGEKTFNSGKLKASNVVSGAGTLTIPSSTSTLVSRISTDTLTNKRITKRVDTQTSSASPTPDSDSYDMYILTALGAAAAFGIPSGSPTQGQGLIIRIKDDGTARALTWNAIYRGIGTSLPSTTTISKTLYLGFVYNSTDTKWDLVAVANEF
jgi:hypothetical protein